MTKRENKRREKLLGAFEKGPIFHCGIRQKFQEDLDELLHFEHELARQQVRRAIDGTKDNWTKEVSLQRLVSDLQNAFVDQYKPNAERLPHEKRKR